jgi:SAM-dependent methyltransferase
VTQRVDFSGNAPIYDRRHGAMLPADVVRALAAAAALAPGELAIDIGAGTGRVAIALADFGCRVLAVDPAAAMLNELRSKAEGRPIWTVSGEGEQLPCAPERFDFVILARLLYLIDDWRLVVRQALGALKPGRHVLHEWANGTLDEAWVQIREKARALFGHAGIERPFHPGARTEAEVDAYFAELGFELTARVLGGPGPQLTLRAFVDRIVAGELSYTWNLPGDVRERCLPALQAWSEQTFDLDRTVAMPAQLQWSVYRKPPV